MEFPFKYSTRILTRSLRSFVLYKVEHEKINLKPTSHHVLLYLLYQHTNNDVFDDFRKISGHFTKILQTFSECHKTFSPSFWKFRGRSEDVSIIHQQN